jgi:hypothetical protein
MRAGEARNLVTVYRTTETRDEYGDVDPGWAAQRVQLWVDIQRDRSALVDRGPGDQASVAAKGYAHYGVDVRARDVLDVTDGPEAGTKWRVLAAFHPRARHTELTLEAFTGSLS